mmetsp:Transcript_88858/g.237845  ORF Transcript_88858/g.237845 Transcript_88858/m.237845 type:complete len:208 (+) Transcript_88858:737-1360(+)
MLVRHDSLFDGIQGSISSAVMEPQRKKVRCAPIGSGFGHCFCADGSGCGSAVSIARVGICALLAGSLGLRSSSRSTLGSACHELGGRRFHSRYRGINPSNDSIRPRRKAAHRASRVGAGDGWMRNGADGGARGAGDGFSAPLCTAFGSHLHLHYERAISNASQVVSVPCHAHLPQAPIVPGRPGQAPVPGLHWGGEAELRHSGRFCG